MLFHKNKAELLMQGTSSNNAYKPRKLMNSSLVEWQ
jgi:hypothetical protein